MNGPRKVGGDEEDRTPGLGIANAALSQLSYIPKGQSQVLSLKSREAGMKILSFRLTFFNSKRNVQRLFSFVLFV